MLRAYLAVFSIIVMAAACTGAAAGTGHNQKPRVMLAAVGDVLFARGVGKQIAHLGSDWPFDPTRGIIAGADIGFCNLECTLSKQGVPQHRRFQFRADPAFAVSMRRAGFTIVSLANNHTMDFGRDAMLDTIDSMVKAGIVPVGAGRDREDAGKLRVIKKNGLKIGFLAYTDIWNGGIVRLADRPTVAGIDVDEMSSKIKAAKRRCDCLVVSFHWGIEYMKQPIERQQVLARLCIDNGADLILGHHPHVLQPSEVYKGKLILYSTGAFVWDAKLFGADKSAIYLIKLTCSSAQLVKTVFVEIINCQPRAGT